MGASSEAMIEIVTEKIAALQEKRFLIGDVPASAIMKWASIYPRHFHMSDDGSFDFDAWTSAGNLISERILLWLKDPVEGDRITRSDPRVHGMDE